MLCFLFLRPVDRFALIRFASRIAAHVCGEDAQLSRRWLTERDSVFYCRRPRSLVLRLLPHVIRRGELYFRSCSGPHLIHQGQVEYIWSGKTSFGVLFPEVPTFGATTLTDCQFSCYSSWCGHLCFSTAHPVLQAIKNRYWPVWFLIWMSVGRYPTQSAGCSLQFPNSIFLSHIHKAGV